MATIISAKEISKSFGGLHLLKNATFEIYEGDRIGLVGRNGTDKSTLFHILMNKEGIDMGGLSIRPGLRIGMLSQYQTPDSLRTIQKELSTTDYLDQIKEELEHFNERLVDPRIDDEELSHYNALQEEMARFDSLTFSNRAVESLKDLAFGHLDLNKRMKDLSGGERRKVALAKLMALSESLDLLLLDEPTNHLDIASIEHLEDFICDFSGTIIVTSHDRYLLDDTVSRIFELIDSHLLVYEGDFTDYLALKEQRSEHQRRERARYQQESKRTTQMIAKMKARNRFDAQIRSKLQRMKRIRAPPDPLLEKKVVNFTFGETEFGGRIVAQASELDKSFGKQVLLENASFEVVAGDRIGLIGPNGGGKTTLLRMLMNQEPKDSGKLFMSRVLKIGYFDQGHLSLDPDNNLIQELSTIIDNLHENDAKALLGRFMFKGDMVYNKVETLSGGERARLAILKLIVSPCNLLLLDEPTNHLDIPSRQIIETALTSYKGTAIFASHDRYFLDAVTNRIFFLGGGKLRIFFGNYTQFRSLELANPEDMKAESGDDAHMYLVKKAFKSWISGRRFSQGEVIRIHNSELKDFKWELDSGRLVRADPPKEGK